MNAVVLKSTLNTFSFFSWWKGIVSSSKQLSIHLSWFCLSLSFLRTILPQLKMEKVPVALDLQLPQKCLCESWWGVPGNTYGGEAQLPHLHGPECSGSWKASDRHLSACMTLLTPYSLSSPPNSCHGSSGRKSSPPPSSPYQSCLLKTRKNSADFCLFLLPLPVQCTRISETSYTSLWNCPPSLALVPGQKTHAKSDPNARHSPGPKGSKTAAMQTPSEAQEQNSYKVGAISPLLETK